MRTRYARNGTWRIAYELRGKLHWRRPWLVLIQGMGLLADRIPGAQLMLFPDLGHLLFWQDPDSFAAAVISFLRSTGGNERKQSAAAPATRSRGDQATITSQSAGAS